MVQYPLPPLGNGNYLGFIINRSGFVEEKGDFRYKNSESLCCNLKLASSNDMEPFLSLTNCCKVRYVFLKNTKLLV